MIRTRRISFDWQIGLIGLSALAGLMIAYQRRLALLQFLVIALAIGLYLLMANLRDPIWVRGQPRSVLSALMAALPAVIAIVFLLTNDWSRWNGKLPGLDPVFRVLAEWRSGAAGWSLNPNVVGGSLAALLPLQIFALRHTRRWRSIPLIGLTIVGLILSQTRGAWLALIIVVSMWVLWRLIVRRAPNVRHARRWWVAVVIGGGVVVAGLLIFTPLGEVLLGMGGDRRAIWLNSMDLVGDYVFTGLGLAGFEMVYSTYALLIHVGHTVHAHNLWLDMWLNQGLVGVIALAGMVLNAVWPKPASAWRMPALLALGVILLHSLADDAYYGYGGAALPVIFVPLGLLIRSDTETPGGLTSKHKPIQPALFMWGGVGVLLMVSLITPAGRSVLEANLGAVAQTQAELVEYRWPQIPIQDALRRPGFVNLNAAEAHYQAALALDPTNVTANRRLGQIDLAREQYTVACEHLDAAYQAAPQQRATRQLLGECKALNDQSADAVMLWQTIDVGQSQLDIRRWWYEEFLQDQGRAAQFKTAMKALSRQ
jgi:O-antigen ligase